MSYPRVTILNYWEVHHINICADMQICDCAVNVWPKEFCAGIIPSILQSMWVLIKKKLYQRIILLKLYLSPANKRISKIQSFFFIQKFLYFDIDCTSF